LLGFQWIGMDLNETHWHWMAFPEW
jgi:hypothetical protein